jgi:hypothetical protein
MGRPANGEVRSTERVCHVCGTAFRAKFSNPYGKYCSSECQRKERHPEIGEARRCRRCETTILVTAGMIKRRVYLCTACSTKDAYRNAEYQRRSRQRNREKIRVRTAAYRAANREFCRRATQEWERRNPERRKAAQRRRVLKRYGLTEAEFEARFVAQGGRCAICRQVPPEKYTRNKRLAIDHCHKTGKVRGLLCFGCNAILGNAKDDPALLLEVIAYIERYREAVA